MNWPKNLKNKKTNKEFDREKVHGKKAFRVREQQEKEAEEEIKKYKIPPCIGHEFENEDPSGV